MDSQNKSSSHAPVSTDCDEARRRFLASMGIGDPVPESSSSSKSAPSEANEEESGVALSSQPDDLELPGASGAAPSRSRVVSYEVKPKPKVATESSSEEAEQEEASALPSSTSKPEEAPENEPAGVQASEPELEVETASEVPATPENSGTEDKSESMNHSAGSSEGPLQLSCPKCRGELVLMPEHVGIEGACVWCETKIVAARSGSDGEVRVFPLFQPDSVSAPAKVEEKFEEKIVEEKPPAMDPQAVEEMISVEKVDPAPSLPEVENRADEIEAPGAEEEESAAANEWSGGFDPAASPDTSPNENTPAEAVAKGFGEVSAAPTDPVEETAEKPSMDAQSTSEMPSGFDSTSPFSGDATPTPDSSNDAAEVPDGFGEPQGFSDVTPSDKPSPSPDEAVAPASEAEEFPEGFGNPAEFSAGTPEAAPVQDEAPKPVTPEGFSNGFNADPFSESVISAEGESPIPADSSSAGTAADSSETWGAGLPESDAPPKGFSDSPFSETASEGSSGAAPETSSAEEVPASFSEAASWGPSGVSEAKGATAAPADSAPVPADEAPKPVDNPAGFPSGFGEPPALRPEPSPSEVSMWGDSDADSAPVKADEACSAPEPETTAASAEDPSAGAGSGFAIPASDKSSFPSGMPAPAAPEETDSFFNEIGNEAPASEAAPDGGASEEEVFADDEPLESGDDIFESGEQPASGAPSLFGAPAGNDSVPPPIPGTEDSSAATGEAEKGNGIFGAAPAVTSQPLGSKPARRKGKGMIVMLVILLGLVCGAALASFVLPVDEYVEKARAFVEQKLTMESEVDPALFLSEMVSPGDVPGGSDPAPRPAVSSGAPQAAAPGPEAASPPVSPAPAATPSGPSAPATTPAAPATQAPAAQ